MILNFRTGNNGSSDNGSSDSDQSFVKEKRVGGSPGGQSRHVQIVAIGAVQGPEKRVVCAAGLLEAGPNVRRSDGPAVRRHMTRDAGAPVGSERRQEGSFAIDSSVRVVGLRRPDGV